MQTHLLFFFVEKAIYPLYNRTEKEREVIVLSKNRRRKSGNSILRLVFVGVAILLQIGWLLLLTLRLNMYSAWISFATNVLSTVVVLKLYSRHTNSALKTPWIMLILTMPVLGLSLYLLFELMGTPAGIRKKLKYARQAIAPAIKQDAAVLARVDDSSRSAGNQCRYLCDHANAPVYDHTAVRYYGEAADGFEAMLADIEKAETFIFMEYFIIEDGASFDRLRTLLAKKAAQGVEVRLMYDDIGSIGYVNFRYAAALNRDGIRCQVFNPALPVLNLFLNHRDHRKITVIDGKIGFTGGFNLADEYFGLTQPYGRWKDTGLRLEGDAVRSLTATFLELWSLNSRTQETFAPYLAPVQDAQSVRGFVQPFGDDPTGEERIAENVYINLINRAENYVWFITPYLIITDEMNHALTLAAKRGVDVRIITPGIPDKKTVFQITRSYYAGLAKQGVHIYEYTPGFCHAKMCVCDGKFASIGTSNLDYRSLYLHFENDVFLYDCDAIADMVRDMEQTFALCDDVTERYRSGRSAALRVWQCVLRLIAPLV